MRANVLALVFSPANVIAALGATLAKHGQEACLTLGVLDWPGMSAAENRERLEAFRRMTASIALVRAITPLTEEMGNSTARLTSVRAIAEEVQDWIEQRPDEILYCHDIHGSVYQLNCIAWPRARRVLYGDAFGHVCTKADLLSIHWDTKSKAEAFRSRQHWNRARLELARLRITSAPPPEDVVFPPQEYRLFLPISDFGYRVPRRKLTILPKTVFMEIIELIRRSSGAADYEQELLARAGSRPAVVLASENYVEQGLMPMEQEISMWLDMLAPHLDGHPLIVVKPHPGESQARWPLLAERLAGNADVCEFAPVHQRMPLEIFSGLFGRFTLVTGSFLRVSLNYMHGLATPCPFTVSIIERYFPQWFQVVMKKMTENQDRYIAALAQWNGKDMLHVGTHAVPDLP
jgi:hypothetical protein